MTPPETSDQGNMVSQRQGEEPRADEGAVSQSQPIIGSVPLPTREAEEPGALDPNAGRSIYSLLASAWYYGGWKAETSAERAMQAIMEQQGWWPIQSEGALMTMIGRELSTEASPLGAEPGSTGIDGACRRCSECEGQDHHWMYVGDEDEAGEPVMSCKHCAATRPLEDDDE